MVTPSHISTGAPVETVAKPEDIGEIVSASSAMRGLDATRDAPPPRTLGERAFGFFFLGAIGAALGAGLAYVVADVAEMVPFPQRGMVWTACIAAGGLALGLYGALSRPRLDRLGVESFLGTEGVAVAILRGDQVELRSCRFSDVAAVRSERVRRTLNLVYTGSYEKILLLAEDGRVLLEFVAHFHEDVPTSMHTAEHAFIRLVRARVEAISGERARSRIASGSSFRFPVFSGDADHVEVSPHGVVVRRGARVVLEAAYPDMTVSLAGDALELRGPDTSVRIRITAIGSPSALQELLGAQGASVS